MLSFKRMRQQSRPIHCKHLSLIESTTARVTLRKIVLTHSMKNQGGPIKTLTDNYVPEYTHRN